MPSSPPPSILSTVLADLEHTYNQAYLAGQDTIRAGVKKLLTRWERQAAANKRWWRKQLHR